MSPDLISWVSLAGALTVLLAVDLLVVGRRGAMTTTAAAVASLVWVAIAVAFGGVLWWTSGGTDAQLYLSGYLVEKSLSLDNVFVFLLVFGAFGVPLAERHRLLSYGIAGALVLRLVMILAGAALLERFSWVAFVFAAFLAWTGWRMWRHRSDHQGEEQMVTRLRDRFPLAQADRPGRLLGRVEGRRGLTPGGAALVGIAVVDVVFAVDSVPAILAITDDAYLVFAANAFALLGLRPLFFLVADLVQRLRHLKAALAALLVFIGAKMAYGEVFGKVSPGVSLTVIGVILATGVLASLLDKRPVPAPVPEGADPGRG
jgi:tellurite resistance protein TerC